ncbi:MAG: hypothetical protein ACD_79C01029G0002 [uncultured bacterium]|nr:MAG: hypothetical protein ACD_79C01029G0002 [uncultured bacterium]
MAVSAINIETLMLKDLMNKASQLYPPWLKLSVIFLIAGYGTKMGLVPMHSWKPDTYGEVPGPVGALMSGAITSCAFLIIMRIGEVCHKAGLMDFFQSILLLLGMLSLFVSCVFILNQTSFNRMLGYSSIEHMGILVLGIGIGGIGIYGSIFHMINNAFAKGIMFLLAETLYRKYKTKNIFDNHGIIHTYPYLGVFLLTGFLYVTGFPPFGTFYSELIILKSAIVAKHYAVAFFYALFLAVIFIGLARIFLNMVFGVSIQKEPVILYKENITIILPVLFLLAISLVIGMHMPAFLENTMLTASSFLGE